MTLRAILPAAALLGFAATAAAQTGTPPAILAGGCQGCHGVSGQGANGIPAIHRTQTRAEFTQAMKAFRANQREATVMGRIARGYSDAEIAALAVHFAKPE